MLNMRSTQADDRSARARIRDAAITRFAHDGIAATTARAVAADAGVSPGLVIHHFGSMDKLRAACDEHMAAIIRSHKQDAMAAGPGLDVLGAMRRAQQDVPLARYLASSLADGSPAVAALIDDMVDDAVAYMEEGVRSGVLQPSARPRDRAALLTVWTLGALVLHEHAERLLGVDLTEDPARLADDDGYGRYLAVVMEVLSDGVFTAEIASTVRAAGARPVDVGQGAGS